MVNGRIRVLRIPRARTKIVDHDKLEGTGESLRVCFDIDDEGDEQMRELLRRLEDFDGAGG
jgi:hypothetical protein